PALLLQPLVENAVKHGIAPRESGGDIVIRAHPMGESFELEVENISEGRILGKNEKGAGIALETLRLQLAHRFGAGASLALETRDTGARVTIRLPRTPDTVPSLEQELRR